jgi:hypothetical protein
MAKVYPTRATISNADAEALSGTTHATTTIPFLAENTAGKDAIRDLMREAQRLRESLAGSIGGLVIDKGGLNIGVFPMEYKIAGTSYTYLGVNSTAVTASQTNYIWVDSSETLDMSTSAFPGTEHIALAIVVAGGSDITSVLDVRQRNFGAGSAQGWAANAATQDIDAGGFDIEDLDEIRLNDNGAASVAGAISRDGTAVTYHDGTASRELYHQGNTVPAADGGTGLNALTAYNLIVGNGTGAATLVAPGTTGIPLLSQGAAVDPAFTPIDLSDTAVTTAAALPESRGGTGSTETYSIPFSKTFDIAGAIGVAVQNEKWFVPASEVLTINKVTAYAVTAPTGAAMIIDVRDDTASIWSDVQGNMCQIAAGANLGSAIASVTPAGGSMIDIQVEQVGSGVAGSDLSVTVEGYYQHRS